MTLSLADWPFVQLLREVTVQVSHPFCVVCVSLISSCKSSLNVLDSSPWMDLF